MIQRVRPIEAAQREKERKRLGFQPVLGRSLKWNCRCFANLFPFSLLSKWQRRESARLPQRWPSPYSLSSNFLWDEIRTMGNCLFPHRRRNSRDSHNGKICYIVSLITLSTPNTSLTPTDQTTADSWKNWLWMDLVTDHDWGRSQS